ncbi:interleukin-31 receptor subunit alpha isoform X2 [Micropterus salmoides]|uniref:interleukin-31 receptor subunit alpha isoform X2 n=1 Tax=Micropterus salmoides TaxID=27706 RepID=UPI0018EB4945|nr:interleukin-31 receptor subunit alpha isoform X2 [Micropterus salmoides]
MVADCGCEIALKLLVFQSVEGDMVGRGFHLDFLDSKCSSHASCSHVFILGLIFAYYTTLYSHVQPSTVKCMNLSSKYQHCGIHPDGVHDLDCFGKHNSHDIKCVWKPGNHTSKKTYMLFIKQDPKPSCRVHKNITEFSKNIPLYKDRNMTAEVFETSESTNCTKAVFRGSPKSLSRCDPPVSASFRRHSGRLFVDVRWQEVDKKAISYYSVSYKALGSPSWSKLLLQSQNRTNCMVENLNSSLVYTVRIQCVTNEKCSQCPWSEAYTVPSELTTQPVIVSLNNTDISKTKDRRLLSVIWKFSAKERYDGFYVTIGKASGEAPCKQMNTTQPEIKLILSYSAYHLTISAFNNASTSPAVSQTIPQREYKPSMGAGKLNVTVHNEKSFTIYWKDDFIKKYVCFSVEWMKRGHKVAYKSFYEDENNYRTLSPLPEPLEPYERYTITLHTRPNKDTCNLKHINNSESTYGSTEFYFKEGSPASAPNISSFNVTQTSVVLQWSSIPEKDIRGFLLGYIIHYKEYHQKGTDITVDPLLNSYQLADLKSGTGYKVQISGFTRAGAGVRSNIYLFTTNTQDDNNLSGVITVLVVVGVVLIFGSPIIKRARVILWPSIPNPGNSNAMQKIEGPCELELLESINTLKVEEWDTHSLHIVEKENVVPASTLASMLPLLRASDNEEDSTEMTRSWIHSDTEDATGDIDRDSNAETFSANQQTHRQSPPFAFSCDYTTMEMFQQVMPQGVPANTSVTQAIESEPEETDLTGVKSGLDYVRQFSTSPTCGSEEMSMVF